MLSIPGRLKVTETETADLRHIQKLNDAGVEDKERFGVHPENRTCSRTAEAISKARSTEMAVKQ